jgi:hypothetical protein
MSKPIGPDKCPITGLPFFMNIDHPDLGTIATYGGPFDSYTIPAADDDDEGCFRSERYDHDAGHWVEGGEPWPLHQLSADQFVEHYDWKDQAEEHRRWAEFYKGTLQNIVSLGHPALVVAEQAIAVKTLPGFASDASAESKS